MNKFLATIRTFFVKSLKAMDITLSRLLLENQVKLRYSWTEDMMKSAINNKPAFQKSSKLFEIPYHVQDRLKDRFEAKKTIL